MSVHDNHRGHGCGTKRTEAARRWRAKRQWSQINKECKRRIRRQALFPILLPLLDDKTKIRAKNHRPPFLQKLFLFVRPHSRGRPPARLLLSNCYSLRRRDSSQQPLFFISPFSFSSSLDTAHVQSKTNHDNNYSLQNKTPTKSQKKNPHKEFFIFIFPVTIKMICAKASNPKNKNKNPNSLLSKYLHRKQSLIVVSSEFFFLRLQSDSLRFCAVGLVIVPCSLCQSAGPEIRSSWTFSHSAKIETANLCPLPPSLSLSLSLSLSAPDKSPQKC